MKKKLLRRGLFMTGAAVMIMTTPAFAMVKSVEFRIDTDSITDHDAGRAFLPPLEIEDEDEGMMDLKIDTEELRDANPTIPYTVHFELHADDEIFDDDLKIRGTGIRQTYVDAVSVDNTQAWGRLLVYPFYRLPQPEEITVDYENRKVSWSEVPYAGDYEVVISYTKKNGDLKTVRKRTKNTSIGVGNEISASSTGTISVSLRALATEEEGYVTAEIVNGVARWEAFSGAEKYRVCIQWNDSDGRLHKKEETTDKNWKDVSAYLNAVSRKNVTVKVRAIPRQNESKYYNIAVSEWAAAGDGAADTSDYDVDDVWEMTETSLSLQSRPERLAQRKRVHGSRPAGSGSTWWTGNRHMTGGGRSTAAGTTLTQMVLCTWAGCMTADAGIIWKAVLDQNVEK